MSIIATMDDLKTWRSELSRYSIIIIQKLQKTFNIIYIRDNVVFLYDKVLLGDSNSFYFVFTSMFVALFIIIFAYYRTLELLVGIPNIIKRKNEFRAMAKDRIKRYLLDRIIHESALF